jgi:glycosyltransferase involved in cell wall biosynthesis
MKPLISVIIPAWNEEKRIASTLEAIHRMRGRNGRTVWDELIVVDDGSTDRTAEAASRFVTALVRHEKRLGKGEALQTGVKNSRGGILLFADADLGDSAVHLSKLIEPVLAGETDMSIARFEPSQAGGGFGLVKRIARAGIYRLTGLRCEAPLSGQRAVRREVLREVNSLASGFGIEVGLTIDAARLGFRISEIALPLTHRQTGKTLQGFAHRGGQLAAVGMAMLMRWRRFAP